jgi:7-carboxy-7-deazaguanine synthase
MLKINEIFYSIQGESSFAGYPCVFIRLTGCNLRCSYCDTRYAYDDGEEMSIESIINTVKKYNCNRVEITGGEPLLQEETADLSRKLLDHNYRVWIETNGTKNIDVLPDGVIRIMDVKCTGSGEKSRMDWKNLNRLTSRDEVKFVLTSREDYDEARQVIQKYSLIERAGVLLSPADGCLPISDLADWMLNDGLDVRLQPQLHRIVWPEETRGR